MEHNNIGCNLYQVARAEIERFLTFHCFDMVNGCCKGVGHSASAFLDRTQCFAYFSLLEVAHLFEVAAVSYVADGGYDLQLCRTFVDARDSCVAIEALDGVIEHKT